MTAPTPKTPEAMPSVGFYGGAAAALVVMLDQATKWLMMSVVMDPPRLIPITPFFNLTLGLNRGVSFGMLSGVLGDTPLALVALSMAIVALMVVWLWHATSTMEAIGLGAIIGGALGNVFDRMRLGGVIDFLDVHVAGWHWPAFNLADAAITTGVALLLLNALREGRRATQRS